MINEELNKLVNSCLLPSSNEINQKEKNPESESTTKISSVGQSTLKQLSDYCRTSEEALDELTVDEVCLLTSVLSKQEDPSLEVLARKASYVQEYLNILKGYDGKELSIENCIDKIDTLFKENADDAIAAIAHFIDSRKIGLEKIPMHLWRRAIPHIRTFIVDINNNENRINKILDELLAKGNNIEFLKIKGASLTSLPSLPKCKSVFLEKMENLEKIEALPECTTFYVDNAKTLSEIKSIPKCISFKCSNTPELQKFPLILDGLQGKDSKDVIVKQGKMAECLGFRQTTFGKIYIFKVKDEFNRMKQVKEYQTEEEINSELAPLERIQQIQFDQFPAVEPDAYECQYQCRASFEVGDNIYSPSMLGYNYFEDEKNKEIYFTAPSLELLKYCWKQIMDQNDCLPELTILNSEGIADNSSFINAFLENDVLLSNDVEFLHDHFFHVLPTLNCMFNERYVINKNKMKEIIKNLKSSIDFAKDKITKDEYESLEHVLGLFVDFCSANIFQFMIEYNVHGKADSKELFLNFLIQTNAHELFSNSMIADKKLCDDVAKAPELWKKVTEYKV